MRYLKVLSRFLLNLSSWARLAVTVLCLALFLIAYMVIPELRNPSIFAVPMALAAWMFRRRGVGICLVGIDLPVWIFYSVRMHNVLLSPALVSLFIAGTLTLIIVGLLISSQRDALEMAYAARQETMRAYEQQQQLNRIKDQFIQNVNHELRTPLTAISGCIELLLEHDEQIDAGMRQVFLKKTLENCDELQSLVSNVLDTVQMSHEKDNLILEECTVREIVHDVIEQIDPRQLQEYHLRLEVPGELRVRANGPYVRRVLLNLLSNALKYGPEGTSVIIKAGPYADTLKTGCTGKQVCISVRDTGPGIPPAEISLLFGQFVRLQRELSGQVRGTGLGLYISKQLVEAMGGRIWVESTGISGEGSCFSFTLPSGS